MSISSAAPPVATPGAPGCGHPVGAAIGAAVGVLADVAETSVWSMNDADVAAAIVELDRLDARSAGLRSRVLTQLQTLDLPKRSAQSSTAAWLRWTRRHTPGAAKRQIALAAGLTKYALVRDALAAGRIHAEQALVIIDALNALPDDIGPRALASAEKQLVGFASSTPSA